MYLVSMDVDSANLSDNRSTQGLSSEYVSPQSDTEVTSHIGPLNEGLNAICIPAGCNASGLISRVVSSLYGQSALRTKTTHPWPMDSALWPMDPALSSLNEAWRSHYLAQFHPYAKQPATTLPTGSSPLSNLAESDPTPVRQITWSDSKGLYRRFHYGTGFHGQREYRMEHRPFWSDALAWRTIQDIEHDAVPLLERGIYETVFALTKEQFIAPQILWNAARYCGLMTYAQPSYATHHFRTADWDELNRRRISIASEIEYFDKSPVTDRTHATREELRNEQKRLRNEIEISSRASMNESSSHDGYASQVQREHLQSELAGALRKAEQLGSHVALLRQDQQKLLAQLLEVSRNTQRSSYNASPSSAVNVIYRDRLEEIDQQLQRWQRTANEISVQRQTLEQSLQHLQAERQNAVKTPEMVVDSRDSLRSLENQILQTRRQLEDLLDNYNVGNRGKSQIDASLPITLKAMQQNLYEVCRQISRRESDSASKYLTLQVEQLLRCEKELHIAIENLLQDRAYLMMELAAEKRSDLDPQATKEVVSSGYREIFGKHDLGSADRSDSVLSSSTYRLALAEESDSVLRVELRDVESRLRAAQSAHAATLLEIRRLEEKLAQTPERRAIDQDRIHVLKGQLEQVESRLHAWERVDSLRAELRDLDCRLAEYRSVDKRYVENSFESLHRAADWWHEQLTAIPSQAIAGRPLPGWARDREVYGPMGRVFNTEFTFRDVANQREIGTRSVEEYRLATLAIRLAIADALKGDKESIPLLIDDNWAEYSVATAKQVMVCLAEVARRGVQVIMWVGDERVAALARVHHGLVSYLRHAVVRANSPELVPAVESRKIDPAEVNRRLDAYANEIYSFSEPEAPVVKVVESQVVEVEKPKRIRTFYHGKRGPFYLDRSSPVEDAPSIDNDMAKRLRGVGIQNVGQLIEAESDQVISRLNDSIEMNQGDEAGHRIDHRFVTASRLARWRAECLLVCEVPQLRPFDSRIMVGCGIRYPKQLARLSPRQLARRVKRFLRTDRGRQVLRSGSGYEVARVTSWIVDTNPTPKRKVVRRTEDQDILPRVAEVHSIGQSRKSSKPASEEQTTFVPRTADGDKGKSRKQSVTKISALRGNQTADGTESDEYVDSVKTTKKTKVLKFYLSQDRAVVDAPSIGPKMAQRLNSVGIITVRDLLQADPESLASRMGSRKFSGEMIKHWQQQSQLVCRVPELRGHDAQLLVAVGVHSPERLGKSTAVKLWEEVKKVAQSEEGKRILRGSAEPDLAEVQSWIESARLCRPLAAA